MTPITLQSPAKLNLFLAITGRREDGFHDLVSVAAPVEFGDTLTVEPRMVGYTLECDEPSLKIDDTNLVLRAAQLFNTVTGWTGGAHFSLKKRIPIGAGLGGGSSNATTALLALNQIAGAPLTMDQLTRLAARLGSDCALFLQGGPVIMRGRGEQVQPLPPQAADRLRRHRVLIFKPPFGISTAWAYGQMAAGAPATYLPAMEAETRLECWVDHATAPGEELLFNNMETPAFTKYISLPVAMERLRDEFDLSPRMSGSGSACFAFLPDSAAVEPVARRICELWGAGTFVTETRLV